MNPTSSSGPGHEPLQAWQDLLEAVRWGPDGLVPVVTRDRSTGDVLMLAYMNREALAETLRSGRAVYYSRSRGALWPKGETSGNLQRVRRLWLDCDADALLLEVDQLGSGACHTGAWSCFHRPIATDSLPATPDPGPGFEPRQTKAGSGPGPDILDELAAVIAERHRHPSADSYTARLLTGHPDRLLKKLAEEAGEVILAAKNVEAARESQGAPDALDEAGAALCWEAADLMYHLLVTLEWAAVPASSLWQELARRRQAGHGLREEPAKPDGNP